MNLILLTPHEWPHLECAHSEIELTDRRFEHIKNIHKANEGDQLRVGVLNGATGHGEVVHISNTSVRLSVQLDQSPPPASPATLILALPRPKVLKRTLQTATALGVKNIYLINSYRVEKSFWQTPFLQDETMNEQLLLGLEQCQDTILPNIHLRKRFKPFVEDELPQIIEGTQAIVAHPRNTSIQFPSQLNSPCTIAIGPEGGFIPYEVDLLESIGFEARTLGPRILKVESAVSVLLGRCL